MLRQKSIYLQEKIDSCFYFCFALFIGMLTLSTCLAQEKEESHDNSSYQRSLVLYWPFDEGKGSKAFDLSGYKHTLYRKDILLKSWPEGMFGSSIHPKGGASVSSSKYLTFSKSFTVMLWLKPLSFPVRQKIVSKRSMLDKRSFYLLQLEKKQVSAGIGDGKDYLFVKGKTVLKKDEWSHIAFTYDRDKKSMKVYVNGKLDGEKKCDLAIGGEDTDLYLGADYQGKADHLNGNIDELRMYRKALPLNLIQNYYKKDMNRTSAAKIINYKEDQKLVHYFTFDEAKGDIVFDANRSSPKCTFKNMGKSNWNHGYYRTCLDFSNTSGAIVMEPSSRTVNYQPLTISAFINIKTFGEKRKIVSKMSSKNPLGFFFLGEDNGHIYGGIGDGEVYSLIQTDTPLKLNKWYHVAFVFDSDKSKLHLFVDGEHKKTERAKNRIETFNANIVIGAGKEGQGDFFNGLIDEVRIYQSALNNDDIKGISSFNPSYIHISDKSIMQLPDGYSVIGHFDFDTDTPYNIKDSSGCNQNGTFFRKNLRNFSKGITGSAFNGSSLQNSITINDTAYQRQFSVLTLSLWINPLDFSEKQKLIIKQSLQNPLEFYLIGVDNGYLYGGLGDGKNIQLVKDPELLKKDSWSHVVLVIDGKNKKIFLYKNGKLISDLVIKKSTIFSSSKTSPLVIGASGSQKEDFFLGKIDDITIYSSALNLKNVELLSMRKPAASKILVEKDKETIKVVEKKKDKKISPKKKKKERELEKKHQKELALYKQKIADLKKMNDKEKEKQEQLEKENQLKIAMMQKKLNLREKEQANKETELKELIKQEKSRLEAEKQKRLHQEGLRKKLEEELNSKNKELELKITDISTLQNEMKKTQAKDEKRRVQSEKEKDAVRKEIDQLTKQIESQKEDEVKARLKEKLKVYNSDLLEIQSKEEEKRKEMQDMLQDTRDKLNEKQKEIQDKEKNIAKLRQDISVKSKKLQKDLQEEKKKTDELSHLILQNEKSLTDKEKEINSLMETLSSIKNQDSQQSLIFEQEMKSKEAQIDAKQKQLEAMSEKNEAKLKEYQKREKQLKDDMAIKQQQLLKTIQDMQKQHEEKLVLEKQNKKKEQDDLLSEINRLKEGREKYVSEIVNKEKEVTSQLKKELEDEKAQKEQLAQLIDKLRKDQKAMEEEMKRKLEEEAKQIEAEMQKKLSEKEKELAQKESELIKLRETEKKEKEEDDKAKERVYQKELALYKQKIADLKKMNDKEKEKQEQLEKENQLKIAMMQKKLNLREKEQANKETELKELIKQEKSRLEAEKQKRLHQEGLRKKLEEELNSKNKELELKITDISTLQNEMKKTQAKDEKRRVQSEKEKDAVRKEIDQLTKQIESQKEDEVKARLKEKLKVYNSDLLEIQSKEEEKRKEMQDMLQDTRDKLNEKQKEIQDKEKNIAKLRQDISVKSKKLQKDLQEEKKKTDELSHLILQNEKSLTDKEKEINSLMETLSSIKNQDSQQSLIFEQEMKSKEAQIDAKQKQLEAMSEKNEAKLKEYQKREKQLKDDMAIKQQQLLKTIQDMQKQHEEKLVLEKQNKKKEQDDLLSEINRLKEGREKYVSEIVNKEKEVTSQLKKELEDEKAQKEQLAQLIDKLRKDQKAMEEEIRRKLEDEAKEIEMKREEKYKKELAQYQKEIEMLREQKQKKEENKVLEAKLRKEEELRLKEQWERERRLKEDEERLKKQKIIEDRLIEASKETNKEYRDALNKKKQAVSIEKQVQIREDDFTVYDDEKLTFASSDLILYWNFELPGSKGLQDVLTKNIMARVNSDRSSRDISSFGVGITFNDNFNLKFSTVRNDPLEPLGLSFCIKFNSLDGASSVLQAYSKENVTLWEVFAEDDSLFVKIGENKYDTGLTIMENSWINISFIIEPKNKTFKILKDGELINELASIPAFSKYTTIHFGFKNDNNPGFNGTLDEIRFTNSRRFLKKISLLPPSYGFICFPEGNRTQNRKLLLSLVSDNANEYIISENKTFKGSQWYRLSNQTEFILSPEEGIKTIYVKFRNEFKMESKLFKKTIIFNRFNPTAEMDSPVDGSYIPIFR